MVQRKFYPFFPERILWIGLSALGGASAIAGVALQHLRSESLPWISLECKPMSSVHQIPLGFSLSQGENLLSVPLPSVEREISFSFDPPRPDAPLSTPPLFVRLKSSAQSTRVSLPSRIDLCYEEHLCLNPTSSSFWMEVSSLGASRIGAKVYISTPSEERVEGESFTATVEESPIQTAGEFSEGSPFHILAEAHSLGHDLFLEKFGKGALSEKIEIGPLEKSYWIPLSEGEWIAWVDGKWRQIANISEGKQVPIARIGSREGRSLILEGWDVEGHVRLSLKREAPPDFKVKLEELFNSVRIRSEKQISCMLEKQCLILRTGDWVFKGDKRWKVLRKADERDAYLHGKMVGELFVLDRIETKGGQKVIQGWLFNASRLAALPIEIGVHGQKRAASKSSKGSGS